MYSFNKPWRQGFKIKQCKAGILLVLFAICFGLVLISRIVFPDVSDYTGTFVETYRDSAVAPPLPFTDADIFWNGEGKKEPVYLDIFSKKEIFPNEFIEGKEYKVYFDSFTKVIVKVEIIE